MKNLFFLSGLFFGVLFILTAESNAQWILTNGLQGQRIYCLAIIDTNLFAGTDNGVFRSTDNGNKWIDVNSGLTNTHVFAFAIKGKNLFAGTFQFHSEIFLCGVFLSTNNGTSWTAVNAGIQNKEVWSFAVKDTNLFAGADGGVFLSTNNGTSWTLQNSNVSRVITFAINGNNLFAGASYGVWRSTDNGSTWTDVTSGDLLTHDHGNFIYALTVCGNNLFAGTGYGVCRSTNNGNTWTALNSAPNTQINGLAVSGTNLFLADGDGVFLSTDNGTTWNSVNNSDGQPYGAATFAINGTYLFAAFSGVWRRPLSDIITGVEDGQENGPLKFSLSQNYPNPFNPVTTISYSLSSKSYVSLKIFDVLGREVASLINEELSAGNHTQQWNAVNMSSGVYFYRLQAGSYTKTKKLILLR